MIYQVCYSLPKDCKDQEAVLYLSPCNIELERVTKGKTVVFKTEKRQVGGDEEKVSITWETDEPAGMYIVTDGEYSDYKVVAAFRSEQIAEQYRDYYNYNTVEEIALNPDTPVVEANSYKCSYSLETGKLFIKRVSNKRKADNWLACVEIGGSIEQVYQIGRVFLAVDEEEANKVAKELVDQFQQGKCTASNTYSHPCTNIKNGRPSMVKYHFERRCTTYCMADGNIKVVDDVILEK